MSYTSEDEEDKKKSKIPIKQDPCLNNQPINKSISDIYNDKSKKGDNNNEVERKNKLVQKLKKVYEEKK